MAGGAVTKESKLLLFDAVLHFTPRTVDCVIELLRLALEGCYYKARVLSFFTKLGLGNDAPLPPPGSRRVVYPGKETLLFWLNFKSRLRLLHERSSQSFQARVA